MTEDLGNRVKGTVNGTTTIYPGSYFEWTGSTSTMKKYYYAGTTRVAMRTGSGTGTTGINWLFGDHLGSQSIITDENGNNFTPPVEVRYKAWGEERYTSGTTPTSFGFTGQRSEDYIKLYWIGSRWYDPVLGRWAQPDNIVPEPKDSQAFDRYAYVINNPIKFIDPSGHCWGAMSWMRDTPIYNLTCQNLDMALEIVQNPDASCIRQLHLKQTRKSGNIGT